MQCNGAKLGLADAYFVVKITCNSFPVIMSKDQKEIFKNVTLKALLSLAKVSLINVR